MGSTVTAFSADDNVAHEARVWLDGVATGGVISATSLGADTYAYTFTAPAGSAGHYAFALYRSSDGAIRATGEYDWDGSDIVYGAAAGGGGGGGITTAEVRTEIDEALIAYDAATGAEVAALNDVSVADIKTQADQALIDYAGATSAELAALNDISTTEVRTEVDAALTAYDAATPTDIRGEVDAALTAYDGTTQADLDAAIASIPPAPTVAEIEAALLDDADGRAILDAISTAVENALLNEGDTRTFLASIQATVAAALTAYDAATSAEISALNDLSAADVKTQADQALIDYDVATVADTAAGGISRADVDQALIDYAGATSAEVAALNDISTTEVRTEVDAALATLNDLSAAEVDAALATLNDLSAAEVDAALATYDGPTKAELDSAVTQILDGTGLTAAQDAALSFVRDVAEADEQYSSDLGVARKYLKGTNTVLVEKELVTNTTASVTTTLTEPTP